MSACTVLNKTVIGPLTRSKFGIFRHDGQVVCDNSVVDCGQVGSSGVVVEVTAACAMSADQFVVVDHRIFLLAPRSIGQTGGAGLSLVEVELADDASFVPLGLNFARDKAHVFFHGRPLSFVAPASFEVMDCPGWFTSSCVARDKGRMYSPRDFE
jgi:hypothetical protein